MDAKSFIKYYGKSIAFFAVPLIFLPVPICIPGQEGRAGYLLLMMAVYWCGEILPLGITGLLPIVFIPLFGIMTTKAVCNSYMESISIMLLGGMFVAIAVEKCNLHRRIATKVLLMIGTSPRWLMLGFMVPTWFLSMWINNTATTAMMMPIVQEVLQKLHEVNDRVRRGENVDDIEENGSIETPTPTPALNNGRRNHDKNHPIQLLKVESSSTLVSNLQVDNISCNSMEIKGSSASPRNTPGRAVFTLDGSTGLETDVVEQDPVMFKEPEQRIADQPIIQRAGSISSDTKIEGQQSVLEMEEEKRKFLKLEKALILCVAYAANAGGTGTIIGTTPNLVLKGQADQLWQEHGYSECPLNFATWMVMGLPIATLNLVVIWVWLEIYFVGPREFFRVKKNAADKAHEKSIRRVIKREYQKLGSLRTAEIQLLVLFVILVIFWFMRSPDFIPGWSDLFPQGYTSDAIPVIAICILMFAIPSKYPRQVTGTKPEYLLDWESIRTKFAWDVVLLVGGGFALAECTMESGLSDWIGQQLSLLGSLPDAVLVIVLGILVTLITQVTSNVASATLLLPIGASMAETLGKNPLYLMIAIAVSVQYAFMLPVATPPNAVAFTTGKIKVMDMVAAGSVLNILCVLVMTLGVQTWIYSFFDLGIIPWDSAPPFTNLTTMMPNITGTY